MGQATLRTERLTLVPLGDEHLEHEVELDSDPEVMRFLTGRARTREEVERQHVLRLAAATRADGLGFWAGFTRDDEQFVGWWILEPPDGPDHDDIPGHAELGYRLLRRFWRRGYAGEGSRELVRHGFADLGVEMIYAQTMAVNAASRATMASAGLRFARGLTSKASYDELIAGAEYGEVEYLLTREQWRDAPAPAPRRSPP